MPPASKTPFKCKRTPKSETWLYQDILQSQQTDTNGWLADTLLMCDGGTIRVHAFILQAASPFFRAAILSQGKDYPYIREVMLPDFPVTEMESMLNLIYKGFVDLATEEEITELQKTLKFFQVTGVDFKSIEKPEANDITKLEIEGDLKIHELNRIPQDIKVKDESIMEIDRDEPIEDNEKTSNGTISGGRRFAKPQMCNVALSSGKPSKSTKSSSSASSTTSSSARSLKSVKIVLPRILVDAVAPPPSKPSTEPAPPPPKKKSPVKKKKKGSPNDNDDPETDEEDKDWTKPNFKDKIWFKREALRCQFCKKDHAAIKDVLDCISHHNKQNVRCCFCLRIYSNTEILYRHYKKRHRNSGKENSIICHFCDQTLAYSAVSSHVISTHFRIESEPSSESTKKGKSRPSPTKTTSSSRSSSSSSSKKSKSKTKNGHKSSSSTEKDKSKKTKKSSASISSDRDPETLTSASENEAEYDSDILEDYDPDPTPILIPTSPSKAVQLQAASTNRRRRYSASSDEWSPRKTKANGNSGNGNASGASANATLSSSSSIPSKKPKDSSIPPNKEALVKVPDLDVSVKKLISNGQTLSFRLRRKLDGNGVLAMYKNLKK
ncbi:unnamed protein product [Orchesella dallaii]|uniref:BTB domain-containing protein n=1 Tax=Orchesella dallaii TaxID=48710 RepID=A0ABP1RLH6_9HEXA